MVVGEETYVELKAKPEEQQSLKEWVQVRVYEQVDRYRREVEKLRRDNDELAEESMGAKGRQERLEREVEGMRRAMKEREEDAKRRMD